jgi:hypothetical protein
MIDDLLLFLSEMLVGLVLAVYGFSSFGKTGPKLKKLYRVLGPIIVLVAIIHLAMRVHLRRRVIG